ncbi:MAG: chemotaxis protein CheW [Deltaproteobacteria bacterium]
METQQTTQIDGLDVNAAEGQLLTFLLAGEEYGVDILRVQEIRGWDSATRVPNTPRYIKGIINLRGTIVPIVDLRERFNLERVDYGPTTVVIVLKVVSGETSRIMGIVVDAVSDVYNLSSEQLRPAPDFGGSIDTEFIEGLMTVEEQMIIVLDIDHLLNSGDLAVAAAA